MIELFLFISNSTIKRMLLASKVVELLFIVHIIWEYGIGAATRQDFLEYSARSGTLLLKLHTHDVLMCIWHKFHALAGTSESIKNKH